MTIINNITLILFNNIKHHLIKKINHLNSNSKNLNLKIKSYVNNFLIFYKRLLLMILPKIIIFHLI
jgi:hypothetical protein